MMLYKEVTQVVIVLGIIPSCLGQAADVNIWCPDDVTGEVSTDIVIHCNISGAPEFIFWFRGRFIPQTNNVPILSLQRGKPGGSELGKGKFTLEDEGKSLIINATRLVDEGLYTLRVISSGGRDLKTLSKLSVYIPPPLPCPEIDECASDCLDCHLDTDNRGEVTCYINNSRPGVAIGWRVEDDVAIQIIHNESSLERANYTWNSSNRLQYEIKGCDVKFEIYCEALSSEYILEHITRRVVLTTKSCSGVTDATHLQSPPIPVVSADGLPTVVWAILIILTITLIAVFVIAMKYRSRVCRDTSPDGADEDVHNLITKLMEQYAPIQYHPPDTGTARGEKDIVPFTHCQCIIKKREKAAEFFSSKELFMSSFYDKYNRVIIKADKGYGKQTFIKKMKKRWLKKHTIPLLIYIDLTVVETDADVLSAVSEQFKLGSELDIHQLDRILKTQPCHLLLGGLGEKSSFEKHDPVDTTQLLTTAEPQNSGLSVSDLLNNNYTDEYNNLTVWVTSDKENAGKFKEPDVSVTFAGMDDRQKREQEGKVQENAV